MLLTMCVKYLYLILNIGYKFNMLFNNLRERMYVKERGNLRNSNEDPCKSTFNKKIYINILLKVCQDLCSSCHYEFPQTSMDLRGDS